MACVSAGVGWSMERSHKAPIEAIAALSLRTLAALSILSASTKALSFLGAWIEGYTNGVPLESTGECATIELAISGVAMSKSTHSELAI